MSNFFEQFTLNPKLPTDVEQKIIKALDFIVDNYDEIAAKNKVDPRFLSFMRPIYMFIGLTCSRIVVLYTNQQAVRGHTRWWFMDAGKYGDVQDDEFVKIAKRDFGLEDWRVFHFKLDLLGIAEDAALKDALKETASSVYNQDLIEELRRRRIVRINPMFSGRDFVINLNSCFILMPFREDLRPVYDDHIKKVVKEANLECKRADDIFGNTAIIEDVWKNINEARIVIADLTGKNPNVFYEVGIAHTIGKDVILITQNIDDVPFDLRHLRHIQYQYTPRGMELFEQQLKNTLVNLLNR